MNIAIPLSNLGDTICSLPAAKYYVDHIDKNARIWTNYNTLGLLDLLNLPSVNITENSFRITSWGNPTDKKEYHSVENAFQCIVDDISKIDIEYKNYPKYIKTNPTFDFITDKHIIISSSYHDLRRKFPDNILHNVINYIKNIGYIPVFIGASKHMLIQDAAYNLYDVDYTQGINLIDQTSLEDLLNIFSIAKMLISSDGGMIHLAALTDIPILGFYTIASPKVLVPIRNNQFGWNCYTISPNIECINCFTKTDDWNNECLLKNIEPNCVKSISSRSIIEGINYILSN